MKFDRSNKFDFCYYGQVNSLRLKSSVTSKWASKHLWRNITLQTTVHGKNQSIVKELLRKNLFPIH